MKKLLLSLVITFFLAGYVFSQITYGPRIGMNFSTYSYNYKVSSEEPYMKYKVGPAFGAVVDIQFNDYLSLQPALMFTKKGAAEDFDAIKSNNPNIHTLKGFSRIKVGYIEIPINVVGGMELGPGQIQVFAGPYISFAVVGRNKLEYEIWLYSGESEYDKNSYYLKFKNKVLDSDYEKYEDDEDFVGYFQRLIDMGFNFGIGYKAYNMLFNIGYSLGLTNLEPKHSDYDAKDYKFSNRVIFINIAYLFGEEY